MPRVVAYWGDRPAEPDDVASSLATFLHRLAEVDVVLSGWRPQGATRRAARSQPLLPTAAEGLAQHLRTQRRDIGQPPMAELGFWFAAWNGGCGGADASILCNAGVHANIRHLRNSVIVILPREWSGVVSKIEAVAHALREVWVPDEVLLLDDGSSEPVMLWSAPAG